MISVVVLASLAVLQQVPASGQTTPAAPAPDPASTPATAPATTREAVQAAATAEPSPIAQVCRTEPVTGSRFGRRVCRSAVETADERRDSQEMLRRMQGSRMPDGG